MGRVPQFDDSQVGDVADATTYVSATQVTAAVTPQQLAGGAELSVNCVERHG